MINAGFVDFLFTGAAIVPEVLMIAGYVGEGLLLLIPLLIAACLVSMYHQQAGADEPSGATDAAALELDAGVTEREPRQA
jgi:hypothetical protein